MRVQITDAVFINSPSKVISYGSPAQTQGHSDVHDTDCLFRQIMAFGQSGQSLHTQLTVHRPLYVHIFPQINTPKYELGKGWIELSECASFGVIFVFSYSYMAKHVLSQLT